ncbi:MAG: DUF937 domain-containing protein [Anaerolineales bacterium]|nr:DUF937 domain-containing protein [Anaerolineales bacterium]
MDAVTQLIMQQITGKALSGVGKKLGVDQNTLQTALSIGMPLLVTALAKNASKPDGAEALHKALSKDHDGSILNNVNGYLKKPAVSEGAAILGHVLGNQQGAVAQGMAQQTGMSNDQVGQLLKIAAPLVMGALGSQTQQNHLDSQGLASFLGNQQQAAQQSQPDILSSLNTLLDSNKDGSALDDVLGLAGKLLGGDEKK